MNKLPFAIIREVESSLGVYLQELLPHHQKPQQRFVVYSNPGEKELGELKSTNLFFKRKELEGKIIQMIN